MILAQMNSEDLQARAYVFMMVRHVIVVSEFTWNSTLCVEPGRRLTMQVEFDFSAIQCVVTSRLKQLYMCAYFELICSAHDWTLQFEATIYNN